MPVRQQDGIQHIRNHSRFAQLPQCADTGIDHDLRTAHFDEAGRGVRKGQERSTGSAQEGDAKIAIHVCIRFGHDYERGDSSMLLYRCLILRSVPFGHTSTNLFRKPSIHLPCQPLGCAESPRDACQCTSTRPLRSRQHSAFDAARLKSSPGSCVAAIVKVCGYRQVTPLSYTLWLSAARAFRVCSVGTQVLTRWRQKHWN